MIMRSIFPEIPFLNVPIITSRVIKMHRKSPFVNFENREITKNISFF